MPDSDSQNAPTFLPFPPEVLESEHKKQIIAIRTCLLSWLLANSDVKEESPGAGENMQRATEELSNLKVDPPYAFTPSPPYQFRSVLLSCIKCYWVALIKVLNDGEKNELAERLNVVPPFGRRIPRFDGKKCVENPGELDAREYEGLMRVTTFVVINLTSDDVVKMWRELAEVGVQTWEETD
ncbi:hypothetical protein GALMADRAFT_140802 [Galerina marginata CBS 339.88]|uniref:Uncharacterized protein n=1 Tax=Galerina marginata (strain CBS 339.88) TaxID=685588 RepID=A0A067SWJ6_GALM3|nr:hypothetical protein GALMADRAFT_140802 [Galerina marginata CBS 339.88]